MDDACSREDARKDSAQASRGASSFPLAQPREVLPYADREVHPVNWVLSTPGTPKSAVNPAEYKGRQRRLLDAYGLVYYAASYGYSDCIQPTPGQAIEPEPYQRWKDKVLKTTMQQSLRIFAVGGHSRKPDTLEEWPESLWQAFYEMVLAAVASPSPQPGPFYGEYLPVEDIG